MAQVLHPREQSPALAVVQVKVIQRDGRPPVFQGLLHFRQMLRTNFRSSMIISQFSAVRLGVNQTHTKALNR